MNRQLLYQVRWGWFLTKGYRSQLSLYFLLELLVIIMSILFVYYSKRAVDISMNVEHGNLKLTITLMVLCGMTGLLVRLLSVWINEKTKLSMTVSFQNTLVKKQMHSVWKYVKRFHTGDLMVRMNADSGEVVQMLCNTALACLITGLRLFALLGFLWYFDPMLAVMIIAISPLFLFSKIYFRKMRKLSQEVKRSESLIGNLMQENLRFRLLIRALGLISIRQRKFEQNQQQNYQLKLDQLSFLTFTQGVMKFAINAGYLLTFIWGIYRLHVHQITFGTMTAFLQLVGRIQTPMLSLIAFFPSFIRFRTSAERLIEIENVEPDDNLTPRRLNDIKSIAFKNVSFRYEDSAVIDNLNTGMNVGEPTAIIGASGKGKTTFIRLLLALIKPDNGEIIVEDKHDRYKISSEYRLNFAYVPQGNTLFAGTVCENLDGGDGAMSEEKLNYALYLACAEFVHDLPEGLNTKVGESGYGLSEGQAQRISIARALIRDCSVWLFDEVTSALDGKTTALLMERILTAGKDKIVIFVTHDLNLAEKCSQVIYMH
ncbi:ABC transporter ATP-binding protein [Mucilaginibacter lappiensis]|uniref:ABC-type multidrug transport system fused ATPase/permease subunit n=1 Tax=Mucilaginibacter lappiensis TaxID=354630 RepID=A0A841JIL0_9SPHI|nr:ABC transporter ATP-binding protein [Mucilaginibacter lappiensis]MBB6130780.1 ABC-type multidrug transport system fused ATPase/permease subunit [Mucilaginibacter lappiensis]